MRKNKEKVKTPKNHRGKIILIILLCIIFYFTFGAVIENQREGNQKKAFIKDAVVDQEHSNSDIVYYKVLNDSLLSSAVFDSSGNCIVGKPGDILVSINSPYPGVPFVDEFISYYIGGHAAIIGYDGIYEIFGNSNGDHKVSKHENLISEKNSEIYILRVKNITEEQIQTVIEGCEKAIGKKYNYFYPISFKNRYYCSDLVSRMYGKENGLPYNLNKDGFVTTIHDLFFSKDTYVVYYQIYRSGVKFSYYIP